MSLVCSELSIRFGGLVALNSVSLELKPGMMTGLIGPNGAGKTTLLNCISRLYAPSSGTMTFNGADLLKRKSHELTQMGITRTFQHLELFESMTVLENLIVGLHSNARRNYITAAFNTAQSEDNEDELLGRAEDISEFLNIDRYMHYPVSILPFGIRRYVDLGRALISKPKLLLLDEPASGMSQNGVADLRAIINKIREEMPTTILLVEHNVNLVMELCEYISVLEFGKNIAFGTPLEIRNDKKVIDSYLGEKEDR